MILQINQREADLLEKALPDHPSVGLDKEWLQMFLPDDDFEVLEDVCRRLDGLPLKHLVHTIQKT